MFTFKSKPSTGIIGFGAFGKLIANHLAPHVRLSLHDPAHTKMRLNSGEDFPNTSIAEIAECDFVILAVPVDQLCTVCRKLRPFLQPKTVIIDVSSVKIEPVRILNAELPEFTQIVATHSLFGPQSAKTGLNGLKIAICPTHGPNHRRIAAFVKRKFALHPITMSPEQHDEEAATVQGITHLIATVLIEMNLPKTRISTSSYDMLKQAIGMVRDDAPCVLNAIEKSNPYAADLRDEFFSTTTRIMQRLQS